LKKKLFHPVNKYQYFSAWKHFIELGHQDLRTRSTTGYSELQIVIL